MPSAMLRKTTTAKRPGIIHQRNFQRHMKTVKSLVEDIADAEDPEDHEIKLKLDEKSYQSSSSLTRNFAGNRGQENKSKIQSETSSDIFFDNDRFFNGFDSDPVSEDSGDDCTEQQTETRKLTEVERLEEVQTDLEEKIKRTKELLQKTDRTRNQRMHGQQNLKRLELKLEKLEQRLERERAGKTRWTFVRRNIKKPKVGFHSSDLLNRKIPLAKLLESSSESQSHLAEVVLQEMHRDVAVQNQVDSDPTPKPTKLFKSRELHEFEKSLQEDDSQQQKKVTESTTDDLSQIEATKQELNKNENEEESLESFNITQLKDRKEMDKEWLRISDRPDGFIKKIQDVSETKQSKQAWVNINDHASQMFARKVFRAQANGDSFLPRSWDGRRSALNNRAETLKVDGRMSVGGSSKEKDKYKCAGRTSSAQSQRRVTVVKMDTVTGTNTFLPPIPKSEAKKRPKEEQVEKVKDENDKEQQKEKIILIPNRRRLARRRIEIYLKQLKFVKSHKLDEKEVVKNIASSVEDYQSRKSKGGKKEHDSKTTPRSTLYLIGALSKTHLHPPTALPNDR
ncbi:uncharacterized protein LOC111326747 [Stylophora pistillata]|nr:uncharacterized protein LOC111326747 [Stylophora pistillata]